MSAYPAKFVTRILIRSLALFLATALVAPPLSRAEDEELPFPADTPEHAALTAASSYLEDENFMLREDYWKGTVTAQTGKAVRLQFFKGNTYRFFFAIEPEKANAATSLSMRIYDTQSREVAAAKSKPDNSASSLSFAPAATGLYLVLMGVEVDDKSNPYRDYPAVLFYGFE